MNFFHPRIPQWTWLHPLILGIILLSVGATPMSSRQEAFNITRQESGDVFYITGGQCGVTRCTELTSGTAMSAGPPSDSSTSCPCRCNKEQPMLREDKLICVDDIAECPVIEFEENDDRSKLPLIFLPLFGQIIHPSKTLEFPDVDNAVCAVSSSQYLTKTGWTSLRNTDGDVPFMFYRDEGRTYLQWRGSEDARSRAQGRVILVKLTCRLGRVLMSPCVAFKVQGTPIQLPHDVSEVWFSGDIRVLSSPQEASDPSTPPSDDSSTPMQIMGFMGLALLLCAIIAIILYGAALLFYVRSKKLHAKEDERSETVSYDNDLQISNPKINPLLKFLNEKAIEELNENSKLGASESSSERLNKENCSFRGSKNNNQSSDSQTSTVLVHLDSSGRRQCRGARHLCSSSSMERRPEVHVSIVEGPLITNPITGIQLPVTPVPLHRKKLYFNPSFFEPHFLKSPPPAAIEFLTKIREVISVAKEKMMSKKFTPSLPVILEEKIAPKKKLSYESFNAKHSSKGGKSKNTCIGCPGCTERKFKKTYLRTLSEREFCKSCVSTEFKQDIVRKWLDEVPVITEIVHDNTKSVTKSIAKVHGTPRSIEPVFDKNESNGSTKKRKKLPPPPPPPMQQPDEVQFDDKKVLTKEEEDISTELKQKMNAVINELAKFRRIEAITPRSTSPVAEVVTPFIPKSVVSVTPKVVFPVPVIRSQSFNKGACTKLDNKKLNSVSQLYEVDSLERAPTKRRATTICYPNVDDSTLETTKRRSSIVAMKELEPMKKIHDMNSRLSKSYQSIGSTNGDCPISSDNEKWYNVKCETYSIKRRNLVSEVYINDVITTFEPSEKSPIQRSNSNVQYSEPVAKPGQLIIKVEDPPKEKCSKEEDNFDPDTLDRKPDKSKSHKQKETSGKDSPKPIPKGKIGSLREIYEAKLNSSNYRYFGSSYETLSNIGKSYFKSGPRSLGSYADNIPDVDIKPPLPIKKVIGKNRANNFTTKTLINPDSQDSKPKISMMTFKITKSEPPMDYYNRNYQESPSYYGRNGLENNQNCKFISLDPTYESIYTLPDRVKSRKEAGKKGNGKVASRMRHQKMHQSKFHKTEDSGYLSSDSSESRKLKRKFILQVKDNQEEVVSDTDEVESMGDAHSESGGESIETNSVFFGSLRRLSALRNKRESSCKTDDEKTEKDCANGISVVHPRERLPDLDNL